MVDLEFIQHLFILMLKQYKMDKLTKLIHEALGLTPKKSCSCGCNSCGNKAPILNENKQYDYPISIHMRHHIDKKIPLHDTNFTVGTTKYSNFIKEAKLLAKKGIIKLNEEDEKFVNENSSSKLYKLEGILVTDTNIRPQSEILSDIRSLPGITIVGNKDYNVTTPKAGYLYTHTVVKVDPYVYLKDEEFNIGTIEQILQSIKDVKGVVMYKAEPKLINIGV